jgi:hypothetical protein
VGCRGNRKERVKTSNDAHDEKSQASPRHELRDPDCQKRACQLTMARSWCDVGSRVSKAVGRVNFASNFFPGRLDKCK